MDILRAIVSEPEKLAIVCLFAVPALSITFYESLKLILRHRERIELIQQGLNPDSIDSEAESTHSKVSKTKKKAASI